MREKVALWRVALVSLTGVNGYFLGEVIPGFVGHVRLDGGLIKFINYLEY